MPGTIISFAIKEGDTIITGDEVCILEAMKMQSTIYAPISGRISEVFVTAGQQVEANELLLVIEKQE